ncbi:hypothetical protein ED21_18642 [Erythrobacter sp. SD-21]|nr:hypothetical protein ED21_18642 [Erythrobacter sp. SD-21]
MDCAVNVNSDKSPPDKVDPAELDPPKEKRVPLSRRIYSPRELAALERRDRMGGWLMLVLAGAAVVAAILLYRTLPDDLQMGDVFVRNDPGEEVPQEEIPFVWGEPRPEDTEAAQADELPRTETRRGSPRRAPQEEQENELADLELDLPPPPVPVGPAPMTFSGPPAGTVDRETARALRTGQTQLWKERGQRGYVLVSNAVAYGSRECRQISYTRFLEAGQASSPSTQWCRIGTRGKWRKDPRGPE